VQKHKHLIIGCGPAALAAAQAIRSLRPQDEIKMVTREDCPPYSPAAIPHLFSGEVTESRFFAKGDEWVKTLRAHWAREKEVEELIPEKGQVKYRDGQKEEYDKLLIATGSKPWVPQVAGLREVPFFTVRTFQDYQRIRGALSTQRTVAIYGGGLVAVELAEKLTLAGHSVTLIVRSSLLRRYFGPQIREALRDRLSRQGVKIRTNSILVEARKTHGKLLLAFDRGEALAADLLIMATGVDPNRLGSSFLPVVRGGLQCGKYMDTPLSDVYVAGDVAAAPAFFDGANGVNPILPEALEQGKIAGYNMAGRKAQYRGWIPWNLLRCFDEWAFNIGLTGAATEGMAEVVVKEAGGGYWRLFLRNDFLVGVEGFPVAAVRPGVFAYLITRKVPVEGYKRLLAQKPMETASWLMLSHRQSQSGLAGQRGRKE